MYNSAWVYVVHGILRPGGNKAKRNLPKVVELRQGVKLQISNALQTELHLNSRAHKVG